MNLLFILGCVAGNLLRGWDLPAAAVRKLAYGGVVGWFLFETAGVSVWYAAAYAVAFAAGSAPGWGRPMGEALGGVPAPEYEWWQKWKWTKKPLPALALRGAMWTGVALPLLVFAQVPAVALAIPAMAIALPLSVIAAVYHAYQFPYKFKYRWKVAEAYSGLIFGSLMALASYVV